MGTLGSVDAVTTSPTKVAGTQTATRALRILRSFLVGPPSKTLSEIAREQGLHKSIAFRLLRALEEQSFVRRDPRTKEYRLGLALIELGEAARTSLDVRREALPIMADLVRQTGETVFLTVLSGDEAVCVELVESPSDVKVTYRVGRRHPLHAGAPGKVLLAYLGEEVLERLRLHRFTANTPTEIERLREELRRIRTQGYAYTVGELQEDAAGVAVPVFDADGRPAAGLGIVWPTLRISAEQAARFIPLAIEAGREISRRLGHRC